MKWIKLNRVAIVRLIGFLVIAFIATLFIKSLYESNDNAEIKDATKQETKLLDSLKKADSIIPFIIIEDTIK